MLTGKKKIEFQASAKLQRLIGRELVPNEQMAIVELVKNAYDSGATRVDILIQPNTAREPGFVRVLDDGEGMSLEEIGEYFMFAGHSRRPGEVDTADRVPTGEKGIGRFAADKLGSRLDVYTKKLGVAGIHLEIDWSDFESSDKKKFNEITAEYEEVDVEPWVRGPNGTLLEITRLRSQWLRPDQEKLDLWLSDLFDPFSRPRSFAVTYEVRGSGKGQIVVDPKPPVGDVSMQVRVVSGEVRRTIKVKGASDPLLDEVGGSSADLETLKGLTARFIHYDKRPTKVARRGLDPGVRVYRDGFRIEPFGSRDADWLGVAERRAKRAGHAHIVPNRLFGFVEISRRRNPHLGDTTSRQTLLDTGAARSLVTLLREQLNVLDEVLRARTEPRWVENRQRQSAELEQARLHTLSVVSIGLAHELRQPLQVIRTEADNIYQILAQRGIEDNDINEAQITIDRAVLRIDQSVQLISSLARGDLATDQDCDIADLIATEVQFFAERAKAHGVAVSYQGPREKKARVNQFALTSVLANLIKNSLDSIVHSKGSKISVKLTKRDEMHRITVYDDGGGIASSVKDSLFDRFTTQKTGGMGFGLYYSKILVEAHRGKIGFENVDDGAQFWFEIPEAPN